VFQHLRAVASKLPETGIAALRRLGFGSPYEILLSTLISTRTRDETTLPVSLRLFAEARTPQAMLTLGEERLSELLRGAGFARTKARDILSLSRLIVEEHGGQVPDTMEGLMRFRGVGPKVAALTLAAGFGRPAICVDTHVHRIVNRWGYVATRTPEQTMAVLQEKLPKRYWNEINDRLVGFGKAICTPLRPRCSSCPLRSLCERVGVANSR
jgi:endonuclease-3